MTETQVTIDDLRKELFPNGFPVATNVAATIRDIDHNREGDDQADAKIKMLLKRALAGYHSDEPERWIVDPSMREKTIVDITTATAEAGITNVDLQGFEKEVQQHVLETRIIALKKKQEQLLQEMISIQKEVDAVSTERSVARKELGRLLEESSAESS